ncbi:MAG: CoA pyrophosphatase [Actinomycetota bacterium]
MRDELRRQITGNLERFERVGDAGEGFRRSAVALVVLTSPDGPPSFLLTRRAATLRAHPGQFALPGGRLDGDESVETTALRELREEVGLNVDAAAVLGLLDDYVTHSGFAITPVVVWGGVVDDAFSWPVDLREVSAVYRLPLSTLDLPDAPTIVPGDDPARPVIRMPIAPGVFIHAPTAAILYQFREVALHARPTRVAHFDQPGFLRR